MTAPSLPAGIAQKGSRDSAIHKFTVTLHDRTLLTYLQNGAAILVHCKGGLGRAGTVAARLLVEMGTSPDKAIQQVRDARPRAIETRAQRDYVRALGSGRP